jgi:hypothetical protein
MYEPESINPHGGTAIGRRRHHVRLRFACGVQILPQTRRVQLARLVRTSSSEFLRSWKSP